LSLTINDFPVEIGNLEQGLTTGPDGNLWFTRIGGIGQINPTTHAFVEFVTPNRAPQGITTGPDGNLWFTDPGELGFGASGKIGAINPTTDVIVEFLTPTANSQPAGITTGPDKNIWFTEAGGNNIGEINPTTHVITEFSIPTANSQPEGITTGPDGNLWFTEHVGNKIGQITPTTHVITEFSIPTADSQPVGIATGPDKNLWFTESGGNKIGEINPSTGAITDFSIPTANSGPQGITAGPDGNLWFTEPGQAGAAVAGDKIAEINPTSHVITEFATPSTNSGPQQITVGPDGKLWFTEQSSIFSNIGQIDLTTDAITEFRGPGDGPPAGVTSGPDGNLWFTEGTVTSGNAIIGQINPTTQLTTEFPIPRAVGNPVAITAGPDGKLWFTDIGSTGLPGGGQMIGEIDPTTHVIAEFPTPTASSNPLAITAGPDGNIWFTELGGNNIGEINLTTDVITEFPIPTANSEPIAITSGPDGNLWFTEHVGNKIGQITPSGKITEFPIPTAGSAPQGITTGPDKNLWFTEASGGKIGEINPTTDVITEFTIPITFTVVQPLAITAGSDGNLWFTGSGGLGQINPTTGALAAFSASGGTTGITSGPDRNIWFTELHSIGQAVLTDLALSANAPASVNLGSNVTYTLTVTDNGIETDTGVTLTDTLPAGVTFVSATGGITPVNGVLTFALGSLAAGASTTVTIVVTPTAAGTLTDSAAASMSVTDATPSDNSVILTTQVSAPTGPDLALSGSAPTSAIVGSQLTYSLTVTNNGSAGATGVTLTDTLPADVTFVSATGGVTPASGVLTFTIGSRAAGASSNITIVVTPTAAVTLTDGAAVTMNQTDPTPADDTVTLTTTALIEAAPDLALSGTAPSSVTVGSNLTYSLTVTNNGTTEATGVTLSDTLPSGATFVSATGGVTPVEGALSFSIGGLAAGASTSVTIVITPTAAGTLTDSASASMSQTDPTPADNSVSLTTAVASQAAPDLALSGTAPGSGSVGNKVTYTLTASNNGSAGATGVTLTDTLPSGVTFVSGTGGVAPVNGVLTFNIGNLAPGASASFTIVVTPTAAGTLTNTASVSLNQTDPTPGDNSVTELTAIASAQRMGIHGQPTTLLLRFGAPVDPAWAENTGNYHVVQLGGSHRTIRFRSAVYDAATTTVTLRPFHRLNLHDLFRLTVVGAGTSGLTGPFEHVPDGPNTTAATGASFVTIISAADLVLTTTNYTILREYRKILVDQSAELKRLQSH
jgi:uncharacterized repeat protein (TIGR01451 family)